MQDANCKAVKAIEKVRICKHCGLPIENAIPHQRTHKECQRAHNNEYQKAYWKNKRDKANPKPPKPPKPPMPEKFCLLCRKSLKEYKYQQRAYCPECAEEVQKIRLKTYNEQTRNECKNARLKKKPTKKKNRKKPVPHCWDLECKSANQIDIEARCLGLTYGKYASLCDSLFIERYLNEQGIYDGLDRITKAWHDFKKERKRQEELERIARANSVNEMTI